MIIIEHITNILFNHASNICNDNIQYCTQWWTGVVNTT